MVTGREADEQKKIARDGKEWKDTARGEERRLDRMIRKGRRAERVECLLHSSGKDEKDK